MQKESKFSKRLIVIIIITLLFLLTGVYYLVCSYFYQATDDAFVSGRFVCIAPKVSGTVVNLCVDDNQPVKKGQLLLEINPPSYQYRLDESSAKLQKAVANFKIADDQIVQAKAALEQASHENTSTKSKLNFAQQDHSRYSDMYNIGASSKQDYDNSSTNLTVASSNYNSAQEKMKSAKAMLKAAQDKREAALAEIKELDAGVKYADLQLSYTKIFAPQDGHIASLNIEKGNYVQVGQPLMTVVPNKVWIVANFKETQLTNMKEGQEVDIKIDTYPHKKFKGKVDSIQRLTGSKASLFPPENAVGSFVKIVQRVPVKITFTEDYSKYTIVQGMSVEPRVKVR